jgi:hypothetical protein
MDPSTADSYRAGVRRRNRAGSLPVPESQCRADGSRWIAVAGLARSDRHECRETPRPDRGPVVGVPGIEVAPMGVASSVSEPRPTRRPAPRNTQRCRHLDANAGRCRVASGTGTASFVGWTSSVARGVIATGPTRQTPVGRPRPVGEPEIRVERVVTDVELLGREALVAS